MGGGGWVNYLVESSGCADALQNHCLSNMSNHLIIAVMCACGYVGGGGVFVYKVFDCVCVCVCGLCVSHQAIAGTSSEGIYSRLALGRRMSWCGVW